MSSRAAIKHKLELLKASKYERKKLIEALQLIREPLEKLIELKKRKKEKKRKIIEEEEEGEQGEGEKEGVDTDRCGNRR